MDSDYLIVGAGAMGMAFADTILTETGDARLVVHRPALAKLEQYVAELDDASQ